MERHITLPLTREEARTIKSGEQLLLSGVIYTARDAAHKRLCELVEKGEPLPFDVKNATIYYVGPTPAKPGQVIGSAGPTTSYRMDAYSPTLIREGETGMIGKGKRNAEVIDAMKKYGAVYFAASSVPKLQGSGWCSGFSAQCHSRGRSSFCSIPIRRFAATRSSIITRICDNSSVLSPSTIMDVRLSSPSRKSVDTEKKSAIFISISIEG